MEIIKLNKTKFKSAHLKHSKKSITVEKSKIWQKMHTLGGSKKFGVQFVVSKKKIPRGYSLR